MAKLIMAQPTMGPNSAPTPPRTPIPSASLIGNIADAKRSVLLILKVMVEISSTPLRLDAHERCRRLIGRRRHPTTPKP